MSHSEKFDLRERILFWGNQGVNAGYLKSQVHKYLVLSNEDFRKIEEKPQSSWSFRELRLLVGRSIFRKIEDYLEGTDPNKVIYSFPIYLFSVWFSEAEGEKGFGTYRGLSLIPHVPFKKREDILMSTLCHFVLMLYSRPDKSNIGKSLVDGRWGQGGYVLTDDVLRWINRTVRSMDIPDIKCPNFAFWPQCGSFYLFIDPPTLAKLEDELTFEKDWALSLYSKSTTYGLRVKYTPEGDFDKESGCLKWKVKEDPTIEGEYGPMSSYIFRIWTGRSALDVSNFSLWTSGNIEVFHPFSFDKKEYEESLKQWL